MSNNEIVVLSDGSDDEIVCVSSAPPRQGTVVRTASRTTSVATLQLLEWSDGSDDDGLDLETALARLSSTTATTSFRSTTVTSVTATSSVAAGSSRSRSRSPPRKRKTALHSHSLPALSPVRERPLKASRSALGNVDENRPDPSCARLVGRRKAPVAMDEFEGIEESPSETSRGAQGTKSRKTPRFDMGDLEVEGIEEAPTAGPSRARARPSTSRKTSRVGVDDFDGIEDETPAEKAERKDAEKKKRQEERLAAKEAEKAQKKYDRDAAKAAKEAEKSYQKKLADANRLRVSKVDSLRDIELHLAYDLSLPSSPIAGAMPEVKIRLQDNHSRLHYLTEEETVAEGTVRFLRRVRADWDAAAKRFVPLDNERLEWEPTLVVVTSVDGIVDRIAERDGMFMEWLSDIRIAVAHSPDEQVFLLVRGLAKYHSKTVSIVNRAYRDNVNAALHDTDARPARADTGRRVTKDMVETQLLRAQVEQHVFVVLVDETDEIEDWLFNLAADVAFRPYKQLTKSHLAFSAPVGQRKGAEPDSVLELMLQEIPGLTSAAALGVSRNYPSFRSLMEAYEDDDDGASLLAGSSVGNLTTGVATSRSLGPALSKKVYEIMRGDDPLDLV